MPSSRPLELPSFPARRSSDLAVSGLFQPIAAAIFGVCGGSHEAAKQGGNNDMLKAHVFLHQPSGLPYRMFAPEMGTNPALPFYPDRKSTRLNSSHVKISYAVFSPSRTPFLPCTTLFRSSRQRSFPADSGRYLRRLRRQPRGSQAGREQRYVESACVSPSTVGPPLSHVCA